jgi:PPOX class probable F420-dependent enzyme
LFIQSKEKPERILDTSMIPDAFKDLFTDDTRAYAFLATVNDDGSPQVTPVWFDLEGDMLRINTVQGRVKDRNMRVRPHVALAIMNFQEPYRYIHIKGAVEDRTESGAREHIDKLAKKYEGTESYEWYNGETRVLYRIRPLSFHAMD